MNPNDVRATVCLSFDFDAVSPWLYWGNSSPSIISRGEFGARVGARRVLALLERHGIPTTWFIPGHTIESYPDQVRAVHDAGHEIGNHGYCHEKPSEQSPEDERRIIERGNDAIVRLTGAAPVGYRSPSWELSQGSIGFFQKMGFRYDSSLMGDDFNLYYCRLGDVPNRDSAFVFGQEVDIVEMPVSWVLDDFPQFEYVRPAGGGLRDPDQVFNLWRAEFDFLYDHEPGGVFTLTMHPQVIGRGPRILMLERLIQHMQSRGSVRFARMGEVAEQWRKDNPRG